MSRRKQTVQRVGDRILAWDGQHIRGRALQHCHVGGTVGHRGNQRHGGRAAADDDDLLTGVVEVLWPCLRVHHQTAEVVLTLEARAVPARVVVVAGGREQDVARDVELLTAVRALQCDRPKRILLREVRANHLVAEVDTPGKVIFGDRLVQVVKDLVGVGDRILAGPRFELVAERVQVRVRPDARVAEQVPGAPDRIATVDDRKAAARLLGCEVMP